MNDLVVDANRYVVRRGDRVCRLTRSQMMLVAYLAERPGWLRSREQILERIRPENWAIEDRSVDTIVKTARRRLRADLGAEPIGSQYGVGYYWKEVP